MEENRFIDRVEECVSQYRGIKRDDLTKKTNLHLISHSRFWVWHILRKKGLETKREGYVRVYPVKLIDGKIMSYKVLGQMYGKDHTTVINGLQHVGYHVDNIDIFKRCESDLLEMIEGKEVQTDPEKLIYIKEVCKNSIEQHGANKEELDPMIISIIFDLFYLYFDKNLINNVINVNTHLANSKVKKLNDRMKKNDSLRSAYNFAIEKIGKDLLNS